MTQDLRQIRHSNSASTKMLSINAKKAAANHRRQNSTPIPPNSAMHAAFASTNHQQTFHRRGLSTGYSAHSQDFGSTDGKVSINDNGHHRQHNMRAAQTPASSRPGQQNDFFFEHMSSESAQHNLWADEAQFMQVTEAIEMPETFVQLPQDDPFAASQTCQGTSTDSISNEDKGDKAVATVLKFMDDIGIAPGQDAKKLLADIQSKFELFERARGQGQAGNSSGISDLAASAPMKRGQSWPESTAAARSQTDEPKIPTAPHTVPLRCSATFDVASYPSTTFMDVSDLKFDLSNNVGGYSSSNYSPMTNRSGLSSFQSSPELAPVNLFGSNAANAPEFGTSTHDGLSASSPPGSPSKSKSRKAGGNKNSSDDDIAFNPNDYLIASNVTEEEINAFIQGPNESGKYTCLWEGCTSRDPFGRKENIRAHVQTHLDDRRYQCDACSNKFVRPNDLKRHWQIHVNKRDFKCFCGAAFNRHDALKRHRERSEWCESSGTRGSPDSPKKDEKKRGRPKKIAPTESQERRERKAFIRREVRKKQAASAASSVVSSQPSPPAFFDFNDYQGGQPEQQTVSPSHTSLTPPASPRDGMEDVFSPQAVQPNNSKRQHSLSPPPTRESMLSFGLTENKGYDGLMFGDLPSLPNGCQPSARDSSQHGTPPSLELGSSSPPRFLDFDFSSDRAVLSQDVSLAPQPTNTAFRHHDDFDQLSHWFSNEAGAESMMGISPSKMDLSLSLPANSDPLFW